MNPALLTLIAEEGPTIVNFILAMFKKTHPGEALPSEAEVEAAYHQVLTESLSKDSQWLANHPS